MSTTQVDFFDENGNNISDFVRVTKGKASPWHSSGTFTYKHATLGDIDIGYHTCGSISVKDGYSYTKKEVSG